MYRMRGVATLRVLRRRPRKRAFDTSCDIVSILAVGQPSHVVGSVPIMSKRSRAAPRVQTKQRTPRAAALIIRNLKPSTRRHLEARAAEHGTTIEAEARAILEHTVARPNLADLAAELFGPKHGVVLDIPPRQAIRRPPDFT